VETQARPFTLNVMARPGMTGSGVEIRGHEIRPRPSGVGSDVQMVSWTADTAILGIASSGQAIVSHQIGMSAHHVMS
jgi:hypothetical protein